IKIKIKIKSNVRGNIKSNVKGRVKGDGQECPSDTSNTNRSSGGLCPYGQPRAAVPTWRSSGAEARFLFLVLIGTTERRALPGFLRAVLVVGAGKSQQQVPFDFAQGTLSPGLRPCSE
ncbi:MAG: hypothetical protein WAL56_20860, partial [Candidatus Sulfotelmatobacter sp.]